MNDSDKVMCRQIQAVSPVSSTQDTAIRCFLYLNTDYGNLDCTIGYRPEHLAGCSSFVPGNIRKFLVSITCKVAPSNAATCNIKSWFMHAGEMDDFNITSILSYCFFLNDTCKV